MGDLTLPVLLVALVVVSIITCIIFLTLIIRLGKLIFEFDKFRETSDVELNSIIWHAKKFDGSFAEVIVELQRANKLLYEIRMGKHGVSDIVETEFYTEDILRHNKMDINKTPTSIVSPTVANNANSDNAPVNEYFSAGMHQTNNKLYVSNLDNPDIGQSAPHQAKHSMSTIAAKSHIESGSNVVIQPVKPEQCLEPATGSLRHPIQEHAKIQVKNDLPTPLNKTTPPLPPGVIEKDKTPAMPPHHTHRPAMPMPANTVDKTDHQSAKQPFPHSSEEGLKKPVQFTPQPHPALSKSSIDNAHISLNSLTARPELDLKSVPVVKHEHINISLNHTPVNPEDILGKTKHINDDE
jgi:hypothetical protein